MKENTMGKVNNKGIYYPPGGILLWIIVLLEVLTFVIGIAVFLYQRSLDLTAFQESQQHLSTSLGMINTLVLLTGGFFMATSLRALKQGSNKQSLVWIRGAILMGLLFLGIKAYEYSTKLSHGFTIDYDSFFTFYWLLTGFHFIHVLVATVILLLMSSGIKNGKHSNKDFLDVESGGIFWHMCDLIWLLLFPVLYLIS